ncbi:MAG TPA: divergent polysaccharide deacetylase family protein [Candidatus Limnocylindria bacterium]|nr:divergent polysaccharide deacetylase family protein [Candidatus Limnocylindria bacterium]
MPKRKARSPAQRPRWLWALAATAAAIFLAGEAVVLMRSESGQLALARHLRMGDGARLTQIVGRQIRRGLTAVGVSGDSIREGVSEQGPAPVRWRVGISPGASLLQANYAVTRSLEARGGVVLEGRESWSDRGEEVVTLLVGLPKRATHQVRLVRGPPAPEETRPEPARLAIVLFGLGEEPAHADSFFELPAPFAVAVVPGSRTSQQVFQAAHQRNREVVLHVPLEPINYPQVNPGPGTVLVTMKPAKIAGMMRRYLDQAEPVAAVANHMGSLATQDMAVMSAVYRELRRSHVPFLHVNPAAGAVCKSLASDLGVVYAEPDRVLDREARGDDPRALERGWKSILEEARDRGRLVALVRATPLTRRWLPRALEAKRLDGVTIVPLGSLIRRPATL